LNSAAGRSTITRDSPLVSHARFSVGLLGGAAPVVDALAMECAGRISDRCSIDDVRNGPA
jgi:hypothetical protein